LDHFEPQSLVPERTFDYFNLVYSWRRCNQVMLDQQVDDPITTLSSSCITVFPDGRISSELSRLDS